MDVPPLWLAFLVLAGLTAAIALAGVWLARRGSRLPGTLIALAHLFGGGVAGFLAVAFYPALPAVAAVAGMLTIRAVQAGSWQLVGMLMTGAGGTWTAIFGTHLLTAALDPAVSAPDTTVPFAAGAIVLVGGLVVLIVDARRAEPSA